MSTYSNLKEEYFEVNDFFRSLGYKIIETKSNQTISFYLLADFFTAIIFL